ncbi:MAG: hypothetical protein K6G56_08695 [Clostridiales bacterium]|nr:hypothetical protein [Clostridiales bacterium]
MKKRFRRKRYRRRRGNLSASNWGPFIKLMLCIVGALAALAFLTLFVMVMLEAVFHVDTPLPPDGIVAKAAKLFTKEDILVVTPTPYYTPEPTATPHPMESYNPEESEREVVLPPELQYYWFGDPVFCGGRMLFTAGKIVGDNVRMCALLSYDPETGAVSELPVKPRNAHIVYPVFNDQWLVYLDGNVKGGGDICACRMDDLTASPKIIKTVYVGQPEIRLDGHYVSWMERTGTARDKLYVCDLDTMETTVVAMFTASSYGTSAPYLRDGTLIWASEGTDRYEDGRMTSVIKHIDLESSGIRDYNVSTYVHDPETNGRYFCWIDAHHSENSTLYYAEAEGASTDLAAKPIEQGVVDFIMENDFVAYSVDEVIYVFFFKSGESFRITPERELAQLLGASDGYVVWMDVTTRERDVLKYAKIPKID